MKTKEILFLTIPFVLWAGCFFPFFRGHLHLEADAAPYADQIGFYTDHLSQGVFPLWGRDMVNGVPYHFFLRRVGDVNPFFFLMVALKWCGVPASAAYLVFLGLYYFLAGLAVYLITRLLLQEPFYAFVGYVLFLFSSWGAELFYNYIIIIFVPLIWFFYFLLSFSRQARRPYFLGMCFCAGLLATTYIPFFFLTVLTVFVFFMVLLYWKPVAEFWKNSLAFMGRNKGLTAFGLVFLLVSCIPALLLYKESKSGEFVLPGRHSGADAPSAVAVGLENAASGDLVSHGYFDRVFDDHANIDMGDIFVPYVFFLLLLTAILASASRLIYFLLLNILALSLITVTSAAGVHRFLFEHLVIFKYIRQLYYFFWLAMLPMAVLLSVAAFQSFMAQLEKSPRQAWWLMYLVMVHLGFMVFLSTRQGVLWGAWAAVFLTLAYFLVYLLCSPSMSYPAGFVILFLAVLIQSTQVYGHLKAKIEKSQSDTVRYYQTHHVQRTQKLELYYTTPWLQDLIDHINPDVLGEYRMVPFMMYDNVAPYEESPEFFQKLETMMASGANLAFVPKAQSHAKDWVIDPQAASQADADPLHSGQLSILHQDTNTWILKSHLSKSKFLVIKDNYHSQWHALINGQAAPVLRADVSFIGLWLPAGASDIVVRFASPGRYFFHMALVLLFAGTFLYLCALFKIEGRWQA